MLKSGDKVKVHFMGWNTKKEIKTNNYDKVFTVYEKNGNLGIDWNTTRSPYTCRGDIFTPFYTFADSVIFENVETGEKFYFSCLKDGLVKADS